MQFCLKSGIFGIRKLESCGYRVALFGDPKFSRFDTIPECDGQTHTHRHTDRYTTTAYTALSIASRSKNTTMAPNTKLKAHKTH